MRLRVQKNDDEKESERKKESEKESEKKIESGKNERKTKKKKQGSFYAKASDVKNAFYTN